MCDRSTFPLARHLPQSQPVAPRLWVFHPEPPIVGGIRSKGTVEEETPLVEEEAPQWSFWELVPLCPVPFARGLSTGVLENACLSNEAIWSGNEHLQPWDLTPAICPCVSFTPPDVLRFALVPGLVTK